VTQVAVAAGPRPSQAQLALRWFLLAALTVIGTVAGEAVGIPSSAMLVGLIVGLVYAVRTSVPLDLDPRLNHGAQAVTGAVVGTYLSADTLRGMGDAWLPVLAITTATLLLTFAAGILLARITDVDPVTAAFGMIAGGAAGIVSIAGDLGADDRLVAVMQYLRVLMILAFTPVIAGLFFAPGTHGGGTELVHAVGFGAGLLLLGLVCPFGMWIGHRAHFTAPSFFGPMLLAAILSVAGAPFAGQMPVLIPFIAFGLIGAKVGLEFTSDTLRRARKILPRLLGVISLMLIISAGLGILLAPLAGVSALDGYLATTPGLLQVVLATSIGMKANTTFVLSAQVVRLLMMLLAAPIMARWLATSPAFRRAAPAVPTPQSAASVPPTTEELP
jgi:membrane AbrB-like protein